ncbi:hypothetical protein VTN31DRAFT_5278 [Thermomyces dupontii]|uniref:uncharacterized protein n=1 Tax=Talaromyces thermophilus TaxID=28565 RepID=UPI00374260CC
MTEPSTQEQTTTTNNAPANVEVDTSYDNDSSYGDELSSYSASLTSSVIDYRHENGRRYHKFRDGSDQHPEAEVIGCDLSPIQPTMVPPNVKFLVDDIESEWAYESDPFDFIHARFLTISIKDFGKLIKQCYRSVKPGGWVEFQDWDGYPMSPDGSLNGTALQQYYDEIYGAFEDVGYEVRPGPKLEQWFKEARFVNIHVEKFVIPYGVWPKDPHLKKVGAWNQTQAEANGFEATALAPLTRFKQWRKEEVIVLASKARADGRNRNIHMMFDFYVVYAQRPEN